MPSGLVQRCFSIFNTFHIKFLKKNLQGLKKWLWKLKGIVLWIVWTIEREREEGIFFSSRYSAKLEMKHSIWQQCNGERNNGWSNSDDQALGILFGTSVNLLPYQYIKFTAIALEINALPD